MTSNSPHYLLFSEASRSDRPVQTWRFVLQNVETQHRFRASDTVPTECSERLELLAVVRGLEALDGPARVTLVTKSRYVSRGLKSGIEEWRANDWCWERFGRIVPVRDSDLWQRIDRALQYHAVDCQAWYFDDQAVVEAVEVALPSRERKDSSARRRTPKYRIDPAARPNHPMKADQNLRSSGVPPVAQAIEKVWANVKSWAHAVARPALESQT